MKLDNQSVVITGASSGIGLALAHRLGEKGCILALLSRHIETVAGALEGLPKNPLLLPCDVSDVTQVERSVHRIRSVIGIPDVLILNAGISEQFDVRVFDLDSIQRQFDVNLFGVLYFLKLFLPNFIERKRGMIVATSSLAGYRGMPAAAPYAASKSAVSVFMESLRIDLWNDSIQVTTISPGFVQSAMTDQNEFYMPFMQSADKAARRIIRGLEAGKAEIHFPYRLSLVATVSRLLPHKLYARIMQRARR